MAARRPSSRHAPAHLTTTERGQLPRAADGPPPLPSGLVAILDHFRPTDASHRPAQGCQSSSHHHELLTGTTIMSGTHQPRQVPLQASSSPLRYTDAPTAGVGRDHRRPEPRQEAPATSSTNSGRRRSISSAPSLAAKHPRHTRFLSKSGVTGAPRSTALRSSPAHARRHSANPFPHLALHILCADESPEATTPPQDSTPPLRRRPQTTTPAAGAPSPPPSTPPTKAPLLPTSLSTVRLLLRYSAPTPRKPAMTTAGLAPRSSPPTYSSLDTPSPPSSAAIRPRRSLRRTPPSPESATPRAAAARAAPASRTPMHHVACARFGRATSRSSTSPIDPPWRIPPFLSSSAHHSTARRKRRSTQTRPLPSHFGKPSSIAAKIPPSSPTVGRLAGHAPSSAFHPTITIGQQTSHSSPPPYHLYICPPSCSIQHHPIPSPSFRARSSTATLATPIPIIAYILVGGVYWLLLIYYYVCEMLVELLLGRVDAL